MLSLLDEGTRLCDGRTRREFLRVGGLGALGLNLTTLLQAQAAAPADRSFGRAKSCIVLWMLGGPPQHETWDPKPDAPLEVRGELGSIATCVPGVRIGELMPRIARYVDRLAILRAVSTSDSAHTSSGYQMLTGTIHPLGSNRDSLPPSPGDWPCAGAVVNHFRPAPRDLPGAVSLPEILYNNPRVVWPGQDGGFLGRAADPWLVECDLEGDELRAPQIRLPDHLPPLRVDRRRDWLAEVDRHLGRIERAPMFARHDRHLQRAFDLLRGERIARAFDLGREDPRIRDRYGRHRWGQCCLLTRRLVEAGVPLVQVNWPRDPAANSANPAWDIHNQGYDRLKTVLMPPMDAGFSALLEDLETRGLLDETLIVWAGEFGRTPRLDPGGSRNHWGNVFSVVLAGAGIRGGQVLGASDRLGAFPRDGLVTPADLTATVFHTLGIDPSAEIHDALGRPQPISRGEVLRSLF